MKVIKTLFFLALVLSIPAQLFAADDKFCTVHTDDDKSTFYCLHTEKKVMFSAEVDPIAEFSYQASLEDNGVRFIGPEELAVRAASVSAKVIEMENTEDVCYQEIYYRVDEFNRLPANHSVINSLKGLAQILKDNGVCNLPVPRNLSHLGIKNSDDVLAHFLCITNSESVFGTRNIGQGGRGPFGINPMHTKSDGLCAGTKATARDGRGREIKESDRYLAHDVRVDNAKCAMRLYQQRGSKGGIKGFLDWGSNSSWGSNRHCTQNMRTRLNFGKYLGDLSCCSASCKSRVAGAKSL